MSVTAVEKGVSWDVQLLDADKCERIFADGPHRMLSIHISMLEVVALYFILAVLTAICPDQCTCDVLPDGDVAAICSGLTEPLIFIPDNISSL